MLKMENTFNQIFACSDFLNILGVFLSGLKNYFCDISLADSGNLLDFTCFSINVLQNFQK